ncbi:MAG TPA: hypothetical protein PJ993_02825 [Candidatus Saccharibacteria bacterium]|nr:hypothetical protein [Candidatus Saccharibacteria bacterium]HMT39839.1 hypothetical protein [Candidatus Saccharibacteria bacterium]
MIKIIWLLLIALSVMWIAAGKVKSRRTEAILGLITLLGAGLFVLWLILESSNIRAILLG